MAREEMTQKKCSDVMTGNPACCTTQDLVAVAVDIMKDANCGAVPVVESRENNKIAGIITDRDICLYVVGNDICPSAVITQDCMSSRVITCKPDDSIESSINLMDENQIRRIVVVNNNDEVVGIISQADIAVRSEEEPYKIYKFLEDISEPAMPTR